MLKVFPGGSVVKNLPAMQEPGASGCASSIPGSGRSPGREDGNPLQYSDRGAWRDTVHRVTVRLTKVT